MLNENILSDVKIPENPEDLIKEWEKDYEENGWKDDPQIQEEIKDQMIRMGAGYFFGLPSPYDK